MSWSRNLRKTISALEDREYALDSIGNSGVCSSVPIESKLTATTLSYLCVACLPVAVYSFFLGTLAVGWVISIATVLVQMWILIIFIQASGESFLFSCLLLFSREYPS